MSGLILADRSINKEAQSKSDVKRGRTRKLPVLLLGGSFVYDTVEYRVVRFSRKADTDGTVTAHGR